MITSNFMNISHNFTEKKSLTIKRPVTIIVPFIDNCHFWMFSHQQMLTSDSLAARAFLSSPSSTIHDKNQPESVTYYTFLSQMNLYQPPNSD